MYQLEAELLKKDLLHMAKWAVILDVIAYSISVVFCGLTLPFAMGLILGTIAMLISLWLLSRTVLKMAERAKETGTHDRRYLASYVLRMAILGIAFVIAYRYRPIAALGAAIPMVYPRIIYTVGALLPEQKQPPTP